MNKLSIAVVFATSLGLATSALGQTSPIWVPLADGQQLVGSNAFAACWNLHQGKCPPCPPGDASPDGGVPGPYSNPDLGPYLIPNIGDPGKSFVAPNSYNYHHYAYDYRPPELSSGCGSCGSSLAVANQGSQLSKLFIQRRHRYRDMTQISSFGPGVFCNYDITLQFDDAGPGTLSSDAYRVEVFDPLDTTQRFMSDGCDGDTQDGHYSDRINKWVKDLSCYDANGTFVTDPKLAVSAVLTNWPGTTYKFDLVNLDPAEGDAAGALAWWKLDDAQGQTAADATGNGNNGTLVNQPSWIAGRIAGALQFDGETNYVEVGNPADLDFSGQLSIAAWVNTSATTTGPNAGSPGNQLGLIVSHGNGPCDMGSTYVPSVFLSIAGDTNVTIGCNYVDPGSGYTMVDGATSPYAEADSQWVHWAGTFDGTEWRLFRNGTLVASTIAATAGASAIDDNWYIGGTAGTPNSQEGSGMFAGGIDDVQIYNRALSDNEIALLAQRKTIMGRLRSITDRNGYSVNVTYQSFSQEQIQTAPDLQMQIDQVSDPYGRTASFSYLPTQVSGRWVVQQINFPNGHKAVYGYANGQLATVTFDDGTQSTFTYGADPVSQCTTVQYFDVAAEGTHRSKTAYLTNNFTIYGEDYGYNDAALNGDIFSQSSMLVRLIANGAGEVTYLNQLLYPWYVQIYRGAGCVRELQYSWSSQYYTSFNVPPPGQFFQGPLEPSYFNCANYWSVPVSLTATYPSITDEQGVVHNYQYDADTFVTNTQQGSLPAEQFSYNQFKQVMRYQDSNSNVTLYNYDGQGNLVSKQVGIKNVNGVDTQQPEYAQYQWTYYPAGDPNQFLMASAVDANGNSTQFIYDNNHRLVQVVEPPDAPGGAQATTTISYDNASRVEQVTLPSACHSMNFAEFSERVKAGSMAVRFGREAE